jgi:hypothetical protein
MANGADDVLRLFEAHPQIPQSGAQTVVLLA